MIKLIVFDLDGVLVEARNFHYEAMNRALASIDEKYVISKEEHFAKYDGLSTRKKMTILTKERGLPVELYADIWKENPEEIKPRTWQRVTSTFGPLLGRPRLAVSTLRRAVMELADGKLKRK